MGVFQMSRARSTGLAVGANVPLFGVGIVPASAGETIDRTIELMYFHREASRTCYHYHAAGRGGGGCRM